MLSCSSSDRTKYEDIFRQIDKASVWIHVSLIVEVHAWKLFDLERDVKQ